MVTYDDYYGIFAARVAWAFRLYGAEAWVLDGGWGMWREEGRPVIARRSQPTPALFSARTHPRLRRTLAEVHKPVATAPRSSTRDRGTCSSVTSRRPTPAIPGARCLPYQELVDGATGLWAAPAAVAALARDAGIGPDHPPGELIATCGSGVSATVALMALERIGVHCDGVYDGSFSEWSSDPSRPVAYGRPE